MNVSSMIETEMNKTLTENGALAYASTGSALLNFFALGGAIRNTHKGIVTSLFKNAIEEDSLLAMKIAFHFRDVREGQGQRTPFREQLVWLVNNGYSEQVRANLGNIVKYGRWDDLFVLLDTELGQEVIYLIDAQLEEDYIYLSNGMPISLLAKWMKSENTSSKESRRLASILRKGLGLTSKDYRLLLSLLRKALKVTETYLCSKNYEKIDYSSVPSQAMLKYRRTFYRHDAERFTKYIEQVKSGEKKINAATLYPQQIVHRILAGDTDNVDVLWEALPNYITNKDEKSIAVVDTSGSMAGTPIEVALSLGIYLAEKTTGYYHNKFITFSNRPDMQTIVGNDIVDKVLNLHRANWDMNTNIEAVFDVILSAAIKNAIPVLEMVDKLYIISDMEFDAATRGSVNDTIFTTIAERYKAYGYTMPKLVFWNVDARNEQFPMTMGDHGVQFVSGYSPVIFKSLMSDKFLSPYDLMLSVINSERYDTVVI